MESYKLRSKHDLDMLQQKIQEAMSKKNRQLEEIREQLQHREIEVDKLRQALDK